MFYLKWDWLEQCSEYSLYIQICHVQEVRKNKHLSFQQKNLSLGASNINFVNGGPWITKS